MGLELAKAFLGCKDHVLVASRTEASCTSAESALRAAFPGQMVHAMRCDVASAPDVKNVALEAQRLLGRIDIWINNAGTHTPRTKDCSA